MWKISLLAIFSAVLVTSLALSAPKVLAAKIAPKILTREKSQDQIIAVELLAEGLGVPWGFAFPKQDLMLIAERDGTLKQLNLSDGTLAEVQGGPKVLRKGQGGLLDLRLHPDFAKNQWVYLSYAREVKGGATTALARAKWDGKNLVELKEIFVADAASDEGEHFGSRIVFSKDGHLFLTIGDRQERDEAQSLASHNGKVLRLKDDGSVPSDNPFVGKPGAKPEIWTLGHRNPQGAALHPQSGEIWVHEHGPRGGDEINVLKKGANYGWPLVTYGREYWGPKIGEGSEKKGMEAPLKYYVPSIAPCGMDFYSGEAFKSWKGDLLIGALVLTHLNRVVFDGKKEVKEERLLRDLDLRIRNVQTGPDGFVYLSSDDGKLLRLKPAS